LVCFIDCFPEIILEESRLFSSTDWQKCLWETPSKLVIQYGQGITPKSLALIRRNGQLIWRTETSSYRTVILVITTMVHTILPYIWIKENAWRRWSTQRWWWVKVLKFLGKDCSDRGSTPPCLSSRAVWCTEKPRVAVLLLIVWCV